MPEFVKNFLSIYFSAKNPFQAVLETIVFIVGIYGIFILFLFILRYYIIYTIAKKLASLFSALKFEEKPYQKPTNKEDELLRDEQKEKKKAEEASKVTVEPMEEELLKETKFKILLPKAVGKWQKLILGQRQNIIIAVAQRMEANRTMNFWQTLVQIQKEQASSAQNVNNSYARMQNREL